MMLKKSILATVMFAINTISVLAIGNYSTLIKTDNFGYRINDEKIVVTVKNPGSSCQLKDSATDNTVATLTAISFYGYDSNSGDSIWNIDFSSFTTKGDYYLYIPLLNIRSYYFRISDDVYNNAGMTAAKSFYYQRCNSVKQNPYSGPWQDTACHLSDYYSTAASGQTDYGTLDLHGGWHDAGDYEKTSAWDRGMEFFLWAYEIHPSAWKDNQLNIPESGNGIPDLLDEAKWELDFYVLMQRSDGHFLSAQKGINGSISSPPSQSDETRNYYDDQPETSTAECTMKLAHAAVVFKNLGFTSIADSYDSAAVHGWSWLNSHSLTGTDNDLKCGAAAAVYRMNKAITSAKSFVENYTTWSSAGLDPAAYGELDWAVWHYLKNPNGSTTIKNNMKAVVVNNIINTVFGAQDAYSGLRGTGTNIWDWNWGSNQHQSSYAGQMLLANYFGVTGTYTAQQLVNEAEHYLHYMHGFNPMNMVYLTNMASIGGEHSSFQTWHSWFSCVGGNCESGNNANYNGKPTGVNEPLYPYYAADAQTSIYGPAPGLVVGGANPAYDGTYSPPKMSPQLASKSYRDWSVPGCGWDGSQCVANAWEITETDLQYTGAYLLLVSCFMTDTSGTFTAEQEHFPFSSSQPLKVYPNPANTQLTISYSPRQANEAATVSVMTMLGEIMLEEKVNESNTAVINVKNLAAGIYLLQLKSANGNAVQRFVKE